MAVITTGAHPKALWPGVHAWFGLAYNKHPSEWDQIFDVKDSTKNYEEDVEATGFGLAPIVPQGEALSYDSHAQGYTKRYTPVKYGLGYIVTEEEEDDNQYEKLAKGRAEALAFSMRTSKEIVHANILDRATDSNYVGGDGKELLATDHPSLAGAWSNELSPGADFSEAALEDLLILIGRAKNARGLQIGLRPTKLIGPVDLQFEFQRVLKSELRVGTGDNDINAVKSMGLLPGGFMVNHYLTDTDQWFVKTDAPNGLTHFRRKALVFAKDSDFDTANKKHKATERYVPGWTDPRAIFGSSGL